MDLITRIASIIVPVFLIVAIGYGYGRKHHPDMAWFNRVTLDVFAPMLVFSALASRDFDLRAQLPLIGAVALMIGLFGLAAWALARVTGTQARTLVPVVMFNNCGNMGLSLALLAFGPANFGAAVAVFSINNLIHFSLGNRITSAHARTRELLTSPLMVGTVLGFICAATAIRPPDMVMSGLKLMGDATLATMLFALGVRLTSLRREAIGLGLLGALARPVIGLAIAIPFVWAFGFEGAQRGQILLFAALPPAIMQFMFAERYHQEPEKVAAMIMLGNAVSIIFIPIALALALH